MVPTNSNSTSSPATTSPSPQNSHKKLFKLEPDDYLEATAGIPPRIRQLIEYTSKLNDAGVLGQLEDIAREGLRAELPKKK
jgi:hypothetical protein